MFARFWSQTNKLHKNWTNWSHKYRWDTGAALKCHTLVVLDSSPLWYLIKMLTQLDFCEDAWNYFPGLIPQNQQNTCFWLFLPNEIPWESLMADVHSRTTAYLKCWNRVTAYKYTRVLDRRQIYIACWTIFQCSMCDYQPTINYNIKEAL